MAYDIQFEITPTFDSRWWDQDYWATIQVEMHAGTGQLVDEIVPLIVDKTPYLTGALQSAIQGIPHPDPKDAVLAEFNADEQPQIDEWGRIYVSYVEGDPLGDPTYTNPPRLMFYSTAEDDLYLFAAWAEEMLQDAADAIAAGHGITKLP